MNGRSSKVLLLGTGATSLPILNVLKGLNLFVGVIGNRPADICHKFANESHHADYSDYEEVRNIFEAHGYSYVVPTCSDLSYETGAKLANEFDLFGYDDWDTTQIITNKRMFRAFLQENKLPHPRYVYQKDICIQTISELDFPVIVKPLEADTGKGIAVISSIESFDDALKDACAVSRDSQCLVEEFRSGSLHSFSCFIGNGQVSDAHIVDEFCTDYEFAVNESNCPTDLSPSLAAEVTGVIDCLATKLNLNDGLLHVQFIVNNKEIYLIECMRRLPGDFFPQLISHSSGYPYYENYVHAFLGKEYLTLNANEEARNRYIARQTITSLGLSYFSGIDFKCSGNMLEIVPLMRNGDQLFEFPASKQAVAFFEYDDFDRMVGEVGCLVNYNKVF